MFEEIVAAEEEAEKRDKADRCVGKGWKFSLDSPDSSGKIALALEKRRDLTRQRGRGNS